MGPISEIHWRDPSAGYIGATHRWDPQVGRVGGTGAWGPQAGLPSALATNENLNGNLRSLWKFIGARSRRNVLADILRVPQNRFLVYRLASASQTCHPQTPFETSVLPAIKRSPKKSLLQYLFEALLILGSVETNT